MMFADMSLGIIILCIVLGVIIGVGSIITLLLFRVNHIIEDFLKKCEINYNDKIDHK